jgi:hypothetical protein
MTLRGASVILPYSVMNSTSQHLNSQPHRQPFLRDGMLVVLAIAATKLIFHCVFNNRYGYFRDEFDYIACGRHLAWGYVDQPPLIPFLTRISLMLLGDSLRAVRFVPALASSAIVVLTAMIAREIGGHRYALILSAIAVAVAPMYLSDGSLQGTNCLEPLLWMGCVYFAILAINRGNPRYWLWLGVVAGIGLEEKYSIAILGFAILVGLLLTEQRRALANKWIWLGAVAAFLIFLPNVIWNFQNHWPFLELMRNIRADGRDVQLSVFQYFAQQLLIMGPADLLWIVGLFGLLSSRRLRPYRMFGIAYLVCLTVFIVLHGKNYYLAPVYPVLIAAGAVTFEVGIERSRRGWLNPLRVVLLLAVGAWFAPLVVPILPVDQFISYMNHLPFKIPRSEHSQMRAILPQYFADQFGWTEMVATVAQAWQQIPADERPGCGIFAQDYGQAGAIDFFGPRYGLPPALSGHQTYFLWGPRGYSGNCLIVLDDSEERLKTLFDQVVYVGKSDNPYALERNIPVFICKGAKFGTLAEIWPELKKWR